MAEKRVRTPQGVRRYNRPVGSLIAVGTPAYGSPAYTAGGGAEIASLPKVISLYQRLLTAKATKDRGMLKSLTPTFLAALHQYSVARDPSAVIFAVQAGAAALAHQRNAPEDEADPENGEPEGGDDGSGADVVRG